MANDKRQTRRDVTGRRPKKDPAVYRYGIKLNAEENGQFELRFAKSGLKYKARFIKAMILDREMKVVKLDKAAMDYYIRLTNFLPSVPSHRQQLQSDGTSCESQFRRQAGICPCRKAGESHIGVGSAEQADYRPHTRV